MGKGTSQFKTLNLIIKVIWSFWCAISALQTTLLSHAFVGPGMSIFVLKISYAVRFPLSKFHLFIEQALSFHHDI